MRDVLIIGGGPSGLAAAKACREEGMRPVVLESRDTIGGVWSSSDGAAWPGMRTNLSHHSCAFSDHPWPKNADLFPTQAAMSAYLQSYVTQFGLDTCVQLKARVVRLQRSGNEWEALLDDARIVRAPQAIVASGFFSSPRMPDTPGIDLFGGAVSHSTDFRGADPFAGKHVVVVGSAYSGCEIATALAEAGVRVTQVVRRPQWIMSRMMPDGSGKARALDLVFYSRKPNNSPPVSPEENNRKRARFFEQTFGNPGDANADLRIDPELGGPTHAAVSDDYLAHVSSDAIAIVRGEVDHADIDGVRVSGPSGSAHVTADALIFATGIGCRLDFLDKSLLVPLAYDPADALQPILTHKGCFHPALPDFGFVGMYRGPYFAILELQARWLAASFVDRSLRPTDATMTAGIAEESAIRARSPRPQFPRGDYVAFADDLAREIGVWPALDPSDALYDAVMTGPVIPAHYRLCGRGANRARAEEAIHQAQA